MIVADTHAWLWWLSTKDRLSRRAVDALSDTDVAISPLTFWEVATLAKRGRISLREPPLDWIHKSLAASRTIVLPVSTDIAVGAAMLPRNIVGDPVDRIIIATALQYRVALVTKDHKIHDAGIVETIW